MYRKQHLKILVIMAFCLGLIAFAVGTPAIAQDGPKVSRFGEYSGYSTPEYNGFQRSSLYVPVRDGTRLAVDVILPTKDGVVADGKLPVIYVHQRYQRAIRRNGQIVTEPQLRGLWHEWVNYGFALVSADIRGGGASFGTRPGEFLDADSTDAYDVIEWIAKQPWSNGNVGMVGVSYNGITQFMAAGSAPPALKAIIPSMALFDLYPFVYPGGIFRYEFLRSWGQASAFVDKILLPVPVDADTDGSLAAAAVQEHMKNAAVYETSDVPFRDSVWATYGNKPYEDFTLSRFIEGVNRSNVAVYQFAGWYDMYPRDQVAWFNNITRPQRIALTPFSHGMGLVPGWQRMIPRLANDTFTDESVGAFLLAESLRFFDYHLKGLDNGIMDEPPVWYYTMGAPKGESWRTAEQWPLPEEVRTDFFFGTGSTLSTEGPTGDGAKDDYTVDYTTTMGTTTRWHNGHGGEFFYGDMREQGKKSLVYDTPPLAEAVEVTGHPMVTLYVSSTAEDGDFFVYLEEVDADGYVQHITEGMLRASHRKQSEPPYNYMGLPFHSGLQADVEPLRTGEIAELVFDLLPTSNVFEAGHRIRVRIAGADADNHLTPRLDPAPTISVYRGAQNASHIDLPVIPAR